MFENISKGEFLKKDWHVYDENWNIIVSCEGTKWLENAHFIAYCFNIQQRYDISKLEEAVSSLEYLYDKHGYAFIGDLLKQIKK